MGGDIEFSLKFFIDQEKLIKYFKFFFTIGFYCQGLVYIWRNYIIMFTLGPSAKATHESIFT
jgi:hypothetical protein